MTTWLRRLFVLAVIAGAAFAVWTGLQRRNEITAPQPTPAPPPRPAPTPPPTPTRAAPTPPTPTTPATPTSKSTAERWREPVDGACPDGYPVKVAKSGIYHVPGGRSYDRTTAERCYMNADDAETDGYRRAKA